MALYIRMYNGTNMDEQQTDSTFTLPSLSLSGWLFKGWATNVNTSDITYNAGAVIYADDYDEDDILYLYAVFQQGEILCYYYRNSQGRVDTNIRYRKVRYNVSDIMFTEKYNTFELPNFSSSNQTIAPDELSGSWSAIGWRSDTVANSAQFSGGETIEAAPSTSNFYAVYDKTVSVSYSSNGGTGYMSSSTGIAYCNCNTDISNADIKPAMITLKSCTFTPPTGRLFVHWSLSSDGTNGNYTNSIQVLNNCTLYAIWSQSGVIPKPQPWEWESEVVKNGTVEVYKVEDKYYAVFLTASEWNNFIDRIFAFAAYSKVELSGVASDYYVSSGDEMLADSVEDARMLIMSMDIDPTLMPAAVSSGDEITAEYINGLKDSLNSVLSEVENE